MTMKVGQIEATGTPGRRDAFHVAGVLVTSADHVRPGDHVRFTDGTFTAVRLCECSERHGIVDPFVNAVPLGKLFWMLLKPNSVGNLVHHFDLTLDIPEQITVVHCPVPTVPLVAEPENKNYPGYPDWVDDESSRADYERCRQEGCSGY